MIKSKPSHNYYNIHFEPTENDLSCNNDFSNASDDKIWSDFKNGNESAFIFIYEFYFDKLLTYGLNFIRDREIVKDCIQDMFIEIRDKRATIGSTNAIKPFLYKILRRKIIRFLHNNAKNEKYDATHEKFTIEISYEQHLIEKQLNEEQVIKLRDAIIKLSTKEREAIFHFYFEGHSYQQIAEIMGYSDIKTARTLLYRAITSLKKSLHKNLFLMLF